MTELVLPNIRSVRKYQDDLMRYFDQGGLRACCVWHRRAGKDFVGIHQVAKMAHQRRGLYWHCLPSQRQGRKVVWEAITRDGERLIDQAFPHVLRKGEPNQTDMRIGLRCGSIYQVVGSDNYDALVGSNPVGVVFSEYSLTDPRVWDYTRPILLENGGWALFIFTPRGYNHAYEIKLVAEKSKDWYYSKLTVDDTQIVSKADIQREMDEGMPIELVNQEFYCDFSAANVGAILGSYIETAEREGRLSEDEIYDADGSEVFISCDIGFRDTAAFWFWQVRPDGAAVIDYMEDSGVDAEGWIERIKASNWKQGTIYLPHDAKAKTFATRHSVLEQFLASGLKVRVLPRVAIHDRINAARTVLPHTRFHKERCERGLMALRDWSYTWDDSRKIFSKEPLHNWASHGGDGFTYGAQVVATHVKDWSATLKQRQAEGRPIEQGATYTFSLEQLHEDAKRRIIRI